MRASAGWNFLRNKLEDYLDTPNVLAGIPAFGASLKTKKDGTFRLATQNANVTKVRSIYSGVEEIDAMDTLGIDALGITETNLNWSHESKMKLTAMICMQFGYGTPVTSAAASPKLGYLPGGTAIIMWGRNTGRITKLISDKLGRNTCMAL